MSETKSAAEPEAAPASDAVVPAPAKLPAWMLPAIVLGTLVAGGGVGALVVGPPVATMLGGQPAVAHDAGAGEDAHSGNHKGGGHGAKDSKKPLLTLENIIVNPAGSASTRFLMASIAFELPDSRTETALREQEVALRDLVIGTLGSRTLEQLSQPGARDSVRFALGEAIKPLVGKHKTVRVYLTQFVLQ
jgi:flagellar basal body-associated protein FliL